MKYWKWEVVFLGLIGIKTELWKSFQGLFSFPMEACLNLVVINALNAKEVHF